MTNRNLSGQEGRGKRERTEDGGRNKQADTPGDGEEEQGTGGQRKEKGVPGEEGREKRESEGMGNEASCTAREASMRDNCILMKVTAKIAGSHGIACFRGSVFSSV